MESRVINPWTWQDRFGSRLLGVMRLALPSLLVEIEATAAA